MPTVAEYPEAVRRIAESDVPDDAVTERDVLSALADSGPQVTADVSRDIADSLVTLDDVRDAVEQSGELPSLGELDAIASLADDHDLHDRAAAVADAAGDRLLTVDDVDREVDERASQGGPLFREEIEAGVDEASAGKEIVGSSRDEIVEREAQARGAPSEQSYKQARSRIVTTADTVDPRDVIDDPTDLYNVQEARASTPVPVVRDSEGEPVAMIGTGSSELNAALSDEIGVPSLSPSEINDEIDLDQDRGRATLRLRGREVDEVEL